MAQTDAILVVNAGSSSLKFQLFGCETRNPKRLFKGQITRIAVRPQLRIDDGHGNTVLEKAWSPDELSDLPAAIDAMTDWVRSLRHIRLHAIGHRIVHGGPDYDAPTRITRRVLDALAAFQDLAPLHQPNNLAPVRLSMEIAPNLPQIACFDTAFHRHHPSHTDCYALPKALFDQGIRRYGFHGLSYQYISETLATEALHDGLEKVIVAHLGSGASMCALKNGESIDSTMGFTALDGLPMGTRPGQLDPGVVLYLIDHLSMSSAEVTDLLYHSSGLLGLSEQSSDMRRLLRSDDPRARFAVDHFVHRCGLHIGMLAAALQGLEGFVFTAGIGENAPEVRARIVEQMAWLGARLDPAANEAGETVISAPDSAIRVMVIPTDEEIVIARATLKLLDPANRR